MQDIYHTNPKTLINQIFMISISLCHKHISSSKIYRNFTQNIIIIQKIISIIWKEMSVHGDLFIYKWEKKKY